MEKTHFNSERIFTVSDFLISHGQLLIRSAINTEQSSNVDLIFFDVKYMQIPTDFKGISIEKLDGESDLVKYPSVQSKLNFKSNFLFEIISGNEKYLIVASFFRVFENELGFNETSLGVLEFNGRDKEI